jgi:branched-chain amino acid transport system ATP-binding protein
LAKAEPQPPAGPFLDVRDLVVRYGKSVAVQGVSLAVQAGEVVTLLGANGAGKSTLLNAITGFLKPTSGSVRVLGQPMTGEPPHRVFRAGVVQVSQWRDLFPSLSVAENLALGGATRSDSLEADLDRVFTYFPRLAERRKQQCGTLSGGEQQMVAVGRALMGQPKVLLLDEPSGGLAPRFVAEIGRIMQVLKEAGSTMLLVEQNMSLALSVADRFYILRDGAVVHHGLSGELGSDFAGLARQYYL